MPWNMPGKVAEINQIKSLMNLRKTVTLMPVKYGDKHLQGSNLWRRKETHSGKEEIGGRSLTPSLGSEILEWLQK